MYVVVLASLAHSEFHPKINRPCPLGCAEMEGLHPSKPPREGALRPFRNPQVSDLSFVICHIIFRT
jgi:hypothetical protein